MDIQNAITTQPTFEGFNATFNLSNLPTDITTTTGNFCNGYTWYQPHTYDNKTERAYLVVRALMKTKIVKIQTLDKFFALMDEIIKVI